MRLCWKSFQNSWRHSQIEDTGLLSHSFRKSPQGYRSFASIHEPWIIAMIFAVLITDLSLPIFYYLHINLSPSPISSPSKIISSISFPLEFEMNNCKTMVSSAALDNKDEGIDHLPISTEHTPQFNSGDLIRDICNVQGDRTLPNMPNELRPLSLICLDGILWSQIVELGPVWSECFMIW